MVVSLIWGCAILVSVVGSVVVETTTGAIQGHDDLLDGNIQFLGIPYANPPVGVLRFMRPEPVTPWKETFKATKRGPSCPQFGVTSHLFDGDENCLLLDVYVPKKPRTTTPLPVFVWIFGGGWVVGDKYELGLYSPEKVMENDDVIVIAINYRLGALGFFSSNSTDGPTGNQALLDQVTALRWINANAKAFGGDPSRITIAGESAGAFSVCWHLASPMSKGLFTAALMESGTCDSKEAFRPLPEAVSFSSAFASALDCKGPAALACLQKLPVGDLLKANLDLKPYHDTNFIPNLWPVMPWAAVIDGKSLTDKPLEVIRSGNFNKVPLLIGTNANEGNLFDFFVPGSFEKVFETLEKKFFPDPEQLKAILAFYNATNSTNMKPVANLLLTDYFFTCSTRRAIRAVHAHGEAVHQYQFTYKDGLIERLLGDAHALELPFVWGHTLLDGGFSFKDHEMSKIFRHYWNNFIRLHEPSGSNSNTTEFPTWPEYEPSLSAYMQLDIPSTTKANLRRKACDFWDQWDQ